MNTADDLAARTVLRVVAEPDSPRLFEEAGDAELPFDPVLDAPAERVREAYTTRVAAYYREYGAASDREPPEDADPPVSAFPRVRRSADLSEEIVVDGDLFGTLLDIYIVEGWAAIAQIEKDLAALAKPEGRPDEPSAGTPGNRLIVAFRFFEYCRNSLATLIRDAIVEIERSAVQRVVTRLSELAKHLDTLVTRDFGITREVKFVGLVTTYRYAEEDAIETLFRAVTQAVEQRAAFERLLDDIAGIRRSLATFNTRIKRKKRHGAKPAKSDLERQAKLKDAEQQKLALREQTSGYYAAMKGVIGENCPIALTVVDSLSPAFPRSELEHALGNALFSLIGRIDELRRAFDPAVGKAARLLSGLSLPSEGRLSPALVQALRVPKGGPELEVIRAAIASAADDPGLLALLHQQTWWLLVQQGDVGQDGFEYIVLNRYLETLNDELQALDESEKSSATFLDTFSRVSAGLSLAVLVSPAAASAPVLRLASEASALALIAYQVWSVNTALAKFDEAVANQLLEPDAYLGPNLAKVGELVLARREFVQEMTEAMLLELLDAVAAGRWVPLRKLLVARGFLQDVRTIVGGAEG